MTEIEKVIKGLESCTSCLGSCPTDCPYYSNSTSCTGVPLRRDALALLKPLELPYEVKPLALPYEVKVVCAGNCMLCGKPIETERLFVCAECSEKVRKEKKCDG